MEGLANCFAQLTLRRRPSPTPGTSGRFDLLPVELVRIIFAFFLPVGSLRNRDQRFLTPGVFADLTPNAVQELRNTLYALCLTNKFFYAIAHQFLYQALIVTSQFEMALLFRTFSGSQDRLRNLVKTFAWSPEGVDEPPTLREEVEGMEKKEEAKVKMFSIEQDIEQDIRIQWPATPAEEYCLRQIRADDARLPWSSKSLLLAVLGMLPWIEKLYVVSSVYEAPDEDNGIVPANDWVMDALWELLCVKVGDDLSGAKFGFLQNLKVFALDDRQDPRWSSHGSLTVAGRWVLQTCPNLRRIEYMAKMEDVDLDFEFDKVDMGFGQGPHGLLSSCRVEEVLITFGAVPMVDLPRILRDLPNLKVLRGEFRVATADVDATSGDANHPPIEEIFVPGTWQNTRSALLEAKNLRELHLTSRRDQSWRGWDARFPGPWPVIDGPKLGRIFPQMPHLTALTIEPISLFDISHEAAENVVLPRLLELLPPSLETLHIVDFWGVAWKNVDRRPIGIIGSYIGPAFRSCFGNGFHHKFWRAVLTQMADDIAASPPLALKEIKISTPLSPSLLRSLNGERPEGGGAWIVQDPSRCLFGRFERLGVKLVVERLVCMTSIPKEEWTYLEA